MILWDMLRLRVMNPLTVGRLLAFLPQFARLFYRLMVDGRVSTLTKLVPALGVLLLLSPPLLELDLVPLLGELDALVVIGLTLKLFIWLCPPDVVREHVKRVARGG